MTYSSDLHLEFVLFVEAANYTRENTLNLIGEYNGITVQQVPAVRSVFNIVFRVAGSFSSFSTPHSYAVDVLGPNGDHLARSEGLTATTPPAAVPTLAGDIGLEATIAVQFAAMLLPTFGRYQVTITIDGQLLGGRYLRVLPQLP